MCSHINLEYVYSANRCLVDYGECSELLYKQASQIQKILKSLLMRNKREDDSMLKLNSFHVFLNYRYPKKGCTLSVNQDKIIKYSTGNIMESNYNEVKYKLHNMRKTIPYTRIVNDLIIQIQILISKIDTDSIERNGREYTKSDHEIEYTSQFNNDDDFLTKEYHHYRKSMAFNIQLLRSYMNNLVLCKMLLELDLERIFYIKSKFKEHLFYYNYKRRDDHMLYIQGLGQLIIYRNLFKTNMAHFLSYVMEPVLRSCYTDFLIFKELFRETLDMSRKYLIDNVQLMGKNIVLSDKYI